MADRECLANRLSEVESQIAAFKKNNKLLFFRPFPHQERAIQYIQKRKRIVILQGSNQTGKTVLGSVVTGSFALGLWPWLKAVTWFEPPVKGRIICADWEHHAKEIVIPSLKEWLPRDTYVVEKNNLGIEAYFQFHNGSRLELLTHTQEPIAHESWTGHFVWADEPLPKDKFAPNMRGLVFNEGLFLITMTAIYEPWILDDLVENPAKEIKDLVGVVSDVPMRANPLLSAESIAAFRASIPDKMEAQARVDGSWLQMSGRVFREFNEDCVIEPFEIPEGWPVVACIDPHLSKPQAIGFYAWDEEGNEYVVDEAWEDLLQEEVADYIICKQEKWNIRSVFIDPLSKGDHLYVRNRGVVDDTFQVIQRRFYPYGIILNTASKDKVSGIRNIQTLIRDKKLKVFNHCRRHIYEMMRLSYDDSGKPQKVDDHMVENLYRSTLTGSGGARKDYKDFNLDSFAVKGIV